MKYLPILVVEDDADLREAIVDTLSLAGYPTLEAGDGAAALAKLKEAPVGLIVSDAQMAPMDGYTLFEEAKKRYPGVPFILMTAYGVIERAIELLRAGAAHYLLKPFEPASLITEVEKHLLRMPSEAGGEVVAESAAMRQLFALAGRVAGSDVSVMISGPSGVGKEVLARYIHRHSRRCEGPFVAVNCAAIPENLLESTLFGHERGAFTGAAQALPGKFEQAQGGTILLDEVTEMPLSLQAKLLRVLQEREVERVGGTRTLKLDIRVLATSNRDLQAAVDAGQFREDLYFRLNVFPMRIPALAERRDDILPLARIMLKKYAEAAGRGNLILSEDAERHLTAYSWEGNIRELENVVQRAVILAAGAEIFAADLLLDHDSVAAQVTRTASEKDNSVSDETDMKTLEKRHILETLTAVGGVKKLAAEKLGISERTLRYKLQRYRDEDAADGCQEVPGGNGLE
ncbi:MULTISPECIES: sigma-54-dependent transcriptional regulator [Chromobacterium]|uniref:Sigma-54-dependent Fis family transcriptional regulator n=2 Tax=Chromobacterium TaxID=535 RepID=A0ABS3GQ29_9NEIS|nr:MULTISPECIES: sigma-54 dependent transcriptional regulator [Chromobacterium]AXT47082.1 sigma-54-dependent Fis family transcriptional regulator [Chromobacterium rhizoryzae]MBK0415720.1 sigma-54-dependent Fis family transcriptional regulator [Chromobacterium haemolyticum]MBO0417134.1 sigma-54-dependent Fis family transcriptional regulator [Chromobacterium haemolyticum]MBO0500155.1 sigma-54-dependent Fis family transcriptional regulator [Chromobacterium haemolyticum]MDH0342697.1 sigma-54 depen